MNRPSPATRIPILVALLVVPLSLLGCTRQSENDASAEQAKPASVLRLATTTSTRDSGLLDELLPAFSKSHNCRVDVVAVGTGAALKLGEAGDADVLLVHAPKAEEAFIAAGHGTRREKFMLNYFVLLGPPEDPAQVAGDEPTEALRKIAAGKHRFVSRGDDSGTHQRELALWQEAGGRPLWDDYFESGQGMGATMVMADEMQAYVLADQGTYLKLKDKMRLAALVTGAETLRNPYHVIVVHPDKHPSINGELAEALLEFLISPDAQQQIRDYKVAGQPLFYPTRLGKEAVGGVPWK